MSTWILLRGLLLAILFEAADTLDSMVGYKNDISRHFSGVAARLDDIALYLPARLTDMLIAGWILSIRRVL